jgi:3-methylcrotonyl-CoA carboxylase alpha subunit
MQARTLAVRIGDTGYEAETTSDGQVRVVARPAVEAAGGGTTAEGPASFGVHYLGHGRARLTTPERSVLAHVVEDGEARWVWVEGRVFRVDLEQPAAGRRRARAAGPETLAAPMPATVIRIAVAPGARVSRGEVLLILEAMKMELPLRAPHDAVVAAVHCAEGDLVQPGVALVALDAPGG